MAEQPPLSRIHVVGYSANDRDFPVLNIVFDPRVAGYQVPKDLSDCPDKRYPNHVFTGAQPISGDQRVRHVYEILPSPWVPFTRYDDDLGPVQGRRRSVANTGQEASLERDKRVTYEAREGSAIVSTELEETWDAGSTDPDEDSPFPIRDRDFYDASRGAVQERRQLVSTTGNEVATLENNNGIITQTSYEAYNEYLSFKIVQTYSVDGPQLVGSTTNNDGQVATVTIQRKASDNYVAPSPTATRTVEASREDAESIIERLVDIPEVFEGKTLALEKPDVTPQKFRAAIPSTSVEVTVEGTVEDPIVLAGNEISKSEQQVTEFVKRVRTTERDPASEATITGAKVYTSELGGGIANVTETYSSSGNITADLNTVSASSEALGDGKFVGQKVELPVIPTLFGQEYDELLDAAVPYTQTVVSTLSSVPESLELGVDLVPRNNLQTTKRTVDKTKAQEILSSIHNVFGSTAVVNLPDKLISVKVIESYNTASAWIQSGLKIASGTKITFNGYGQVAVTGDLVYEIEQGYNGPVEADRHIFFMLREDATLNNVLAKVNEKYADPVLNWPMIRPKAHTIVVSGGTVELSGGILVNGMGIGETDPEAEVTSLNRDYSGSVATSTTAIPPTLHDFIEIERETITVADIRSGDIDPDFEQELEDTLYSQITVGVASNDLDAQGRLKPTTPISFEEGLYLLQIDTEPYRFGMVRVSAVVVNITSTYL